jgi:CheY-like chemotaxis protein
MSALRTAVREFLRSTGYTVLEASNGMEALPISEGYQGRIDLLLTDYIMPGLSGPRLGTLAMKQQPTSPHYLHVWLRRRGNSGTGLL